MKSKSAATVKEMIKTKIRCHHYSVYTDWMYTFQNDAQMQSYSITTTTQKIIIAYEQGQI